MNEEQFIQKNISALLSHSHVKSKTGEIGGEWKVHEIHYIHPMLRNIEFSVVLVNGGQRCIRVEAKIHRQTGKLSNVEIEEI